MAEQHHLQHAINELQILDGSKIIVYVEARGGRSQDFTNMIVTMMELGTQGALGGPIRPKNGAWLTIPTSLAGDRAAREIPGLFKPRGKKVLVTSNGSGFNVYFYLRKEVNIPKRPFLGPTMIAHAPEYADMVKEGVLRLLIDNDYMADDIMTRVGKRMARDVKRQIMNGDFTANAPATLARKNGDRPLIDTGAMLNGVRYKIIH